MKKIFNFSFLLLTTFAFTQENQTQIFTPIYDIEATTVKSQGKTGTCWSFSTSSFLETEVFRKKGVIVDLSEIYSVRNTVE